jgi:hypothetical protein
MDLRSGDHHAERRVISIELNLFPATWRITDFSPFAQVISAEKKWKRLSAKARFSQPPQ